MAAISEWEKKLDGGTSACACVFVNIAALCRSCYHVLETEEGAFVGRGDDTFRNPHRAQFVQFELFELILLLNLDKQFPVEQFEATVSQSTVPSPPPFRHESKAWAKTKQQAQIESAKGFSSATKVVA